MSTAAHPTAASEPARVLIVDDSAVARALIARMVDASDRFCVARSVPTAAAAMAWLATDRVDVVLLDVEMPGVDGLTALPDLIAASRGAKVVIVSSSAQDGAATTVQALALGAADTLVKPVAGAGGSAQFGAQLLDKLERLLASDAPITPVQAVRAAPPPRATSAANSYDIVAIGASTGGIHALSLMLRCLPASFRLPIIVTQHLPTSFMPYFAAQLAVLAGRPCEVATDRLRIRAGRMIVAPGDAHLRCVSLGDGAAIRLNVDPSTTGCMPSVDPMLTSLAEVYGSRLLAVILSGMGRDGAAGAQAVRNAGGCVVVQDQASSVIWGMPGAVAQAGHADAVLDPQAIGLLAASGRRP